MYYTLYVAFVMLLFPAISVAIEIMSNRKKKIDSNFIGTMCKWFIFWTLGIRLFTGGLMQTLNPAFTADLLQVNSTNFVVIRELGCGTLSMGTIGILSLFIPTWRKPAALCLGLYLFGCTIIHINRLPIDINLKEIIAMIGDIWAVAVVIIHFLGDKLRIKRIA